METVIAKFLMTNPVGRRLMNVIHPWVHPGIRPYTIGQYGCWLCRFAFRAISKNWPAEPFRDQSSIKVSEPEYDADGTLIKRGIHMSATVRRQLDELIAKDPELEKKLKEAMDRIATEGPEKEN